MVAKVPGDNSPIVECFYCDGEIEGSAPCIVQIGSSRAIYFHLECSIEFCLAMMKDICLMKSDQGLVLQLVTDP